MIGNLFDNAKFGDMFLTTENKQAVFLRFAENAEYKFAILYVEDWGNVQVFRHNGKEIYNDAAHSIISKQEEPVSEDLEEAASRYAKGEYNRKNPATLSDRCRGCYAPLIYAFKAGAKWQKEQMMTKSIEAVVSQVPCSNEIILYNPFSVDKYYLPQEMNKLGLNKGDKIKLVIIKED